MTETRKRQIATLKKWAEALRSGRYRQKRNVLREGTTNKMCCLGVLCDIVDPSGWSEEGYHRGNPEFPAMSVLRHAGISFTDMIFAEPKDANNFATLNDEDKATYEEIADVVDWVRYDLEASK